MSFYQVDWWLAACNMFKKCFFLLFVESSSSSSGFFGQPDGGVLFFRLTGYFLISLVDFLFHLDKTSFCVLMW